MTVTLLWLLNKQQNKYLQEIGDQSTLRNSLNFSKSFKLWEMVLFILAITFLVFALLRPQWGETRQTVKKKGLDIVIALDISKSMNAEDIRPSRIGKAVIELDRLLERLSDHRVGLVTFAGSATPICPLTTDLRAIKMFLQTIKDYQEPIPGTNIENAFDRALEMYDYQAAQDRIFLVITDGENHQGNLEGIAAQARSKEVIVIPVAVGTTQGQPIPAYNEKGERSGYKKDKSGEIIISHTDLAALKKIASLGPYQIDNNYATISSIARDIRVFRMNALKELRISIYAERYQLFLLIGFLLLMLSYAFNNCHKFFRKGILKHEQ